jgi:hypothetical protein
MSVDPVQGAGQPAKKGIGVWGWVAIGCGLLMVLGLVTCFGVGMFVKNKVSGMASDFEKNPAKAAAEMAVRLNPDVELVSSDDEKMTVKDKKTGKVVTVNFEDAQEGKFSFETEDGKSTVDVNGAGQGDSGTGSLTFTGPDGQKATFGAGNTAADLPSWLPAYPGAEVAGNFTADTAEGKAGAVTVTTTDSVDAVATFYEGKLKDAGLAVQKMTMSGEGGSGVTLVGSEDGGKRVANVTIGSTDGKTSAMVTYNEKK